MIDGMYHKMKEVYNDRFDFIVTEIAANKPRSLRAHNRVGFKDLAVYHNLKTGDPWRVVVLDIDSD